MQPARLLPLATTALLLLSTLLLTACAAWHPFGIGEASTGTVAAGHAAISSSSHPILTILVTLGVLISAASLFATIVVNRIFFVGAIGGLALVICALTVEFVVDHALWFIIGSLGLIGAYVVIHTHAFAQVNIALEKVKAGMPATEPSWIVRLFSWLHLPASWSAQQTPSAPSTPPAPTTPKP